MSFDELPPDGAPAQPEEAAGNPGVENRVEDAPPSAAPRKTRRSKAAGTDAASTADTPAPAARSRARSKSPVKPPAETTAAPEEARAEPEPVSDAPSARPARRRTAKKTQAAQPVAEETAQAPVVQTEVPVVQTEAAAAPASKPKPARSRKKTVPEPAPADAPQEAAEVLPAAEESAIDNAETAAETVKAKTRRSRSKSSRAKTAPAEAAVSADEPEAEAQPGAEAEAAAQESASGARRRRNRRSRGRKEAPSLPAPQSPQKLAAQSAPEPEPEPVIDTSRGAHLLQHRGIPIIHIHGVPYPSALFFGNLEAEENHERVLRQVQMAAQAGIHLHSTLVELTCPLPQNSGALQEIDARLQTLLQADPNGFVMPRIVFVPARGWRRENPAELCVYADDSGGDPSLASERFWKECESSLQTLVEHIRSREWAERVFGFHLERGEWFQPAAGGADRSTANRDGFREWLKERYRGSVVALRAAWRDADVQFHTVEIPPARLKTDPNQAFYEARSERQYTDFALYTSAIAASRIRGLARVIKRASHYQCLVSVCYGYTLEFSHGDSGHLALGALLQDRNIDLLCGPPSYRDRQPGGAASFPAPIDSVLMHGKLWVSEDDTRTWLSAEDTSNDFNLRLPDQYAVHQAHARAMGRALAHRTAVQWMDLWGEGWLDSPDIWQHIHEFVLCSANPSPAEQPEVVAIFDEESLLHIQRGEAFFSRFTTEMRETLQRAGIRCSFHLQNDLLHPHFPTDAKLYLFLTPFQISAAQKQAIQEKLHNGGKTLVWLYAPAVCEAKPAAGSGSMLETATSTVGILLRQQPWNSRIGSHFLDNNHPITRSLGNREYGTRERLNPSFYVEDTEAVALAEYHGSGLPSVAVKEMPGWKSIFVGEPLLTAGLLRGICQYAGVHTYCDAEDVLDEGCGWLTMHICKDGNRVLRVPAYTPLYDLTHRNTVLSGQNGNEREYRFYAHAGSTHRFFAGYTGVLQTLGFPTALHFQPETEHDALPEPEPILPEPATLLPDLFLDDPALPAPENPDLEILRAVLQMPMPSMDELPLMEEEELMILPESEEQRVASAALVQKILQENSTEAGNKRRRRRGGRGRGNRNDSGSMPEE